MNKLVILIVILSIVAILLQIIGGIVNAMQNGGVCVNIMNKKLQITSEHLWCDALFLMEFVILLAIIYSTST